MKIYKDMQAVSKVTGQFEYILPTDTRLKIQKILYSSSRDLTLNYQ